MADLIVRPTPSDLEQGAFAKRGKASIGGLSFSWFSKGGLGVDGDGIFLLDADGVRHPIPMPSNGELVRFTMEGSTGADIYMGLPELFFADEQQHRIAQLPADGFVDTDFTQFGQAAGVRWLDLGSRRSIGKYGRYGGYPKTDQTIDLVGCILAEADKRKGGLFHRRRSK